MNPETFETLAVELKTAFEAYNEKKNMTTRRDVRKVLQSIKTAAQDSRVWILKDCPGKE